MSTGTVVLMVIMSIAEACTNFFLEHRSIIELFLSKNQLVLTLSGLGDTPDFRHDKLTFSNIINQAVPSHLFLS